MINKINALTRAFTQVNPRLEMQSVVGTLLAETPPRVKQYEIARSYIIPPVTAVEKKHPLKEWRRSANKQIVFGKVKSVRSSFTTGEKGEEVDLLL
jgi:hypothetical protein